MDRLFRLAYDGEIGYALKRGDGWLRLEGDPFGRCAPGAPIEAASVRILAPVAPSKIVAVGLNYRDHAREMEAAIPDEPLIFLKPSTAVIGPGDDIVLPPVSSRVDYEAELGVVIGRRACRVPEEQAQDYVLGLTCVNDVTARDLQRRDVQYTRAKGFDTFAPVGPCIAVGLDWRALDIESRVNGVRRQASNTRELIFDVRRLVAFVSAVMTLHAGDVLATGTPAGVGPLAPGDQVAVSIDGIGELVNGVVSA